MQEFIDFLKDFPEIKTCNIAVLGLGYVGLPLAYQFSKFKENLDATLYKGKVIGFDINKKRINQLKLGIDNTNEVSKDELLQVQNLKFTSEQNQLVDSDVFIITVPTPLRDNNQPDFSALSNASRIVGEILKERNSLKNKKVPVVIYESTVFPGATEEICLPILKQSSEMYLYKDKLNNSFALGYSPERVNPGDKKNRLADIVKVTSGSCTKSSMWIDELYKTIIKAGTHRVKTIKIAEASKVIENVQRDLNIAIVNEFALIFNKLSIDTNDVLDAAKTKWNFLDFKPGLVGGHCIGVDPYYLTYKAKQFGYYPDLISSGRRLNNEMGFWIAEQIIVHIVGRSLNSSNAKILILGVTFKENCPDIRNSKVIDIYNSLKKFNFDIKIVDPEADVGKTKSDLGIEISKELDKKDTFDVVIVCVAHKLFKKFSLRNWQELIKKDGFIYDIKGIVPREINPIRL